MLPPNRGHPLSQAVRPASSPTGEPSPTSPERFSRCSRPRRRTAASCKAEDGATAPEGFPAVRRIPFKMHQGEFAEAPLLPPLGEVPRSGKGGAVGIFELLPFNEPHPLSQPLRAASSPTGEPSLTAPERGGGASRRRGQARYAEYHLECTWANPYRPPLASPGGKLALSAALRNR